MTAAETLRRRWLEGGYYLLAMSQGDFEIVEALAELAPIPKPEVVYTTEPPVPFEGASCELHG